MNTPVYDLRGGLDLQKETFAPGHLITTHHIPGVDFEPLAIDAPVLEPVKFAREHPLHLKADGRTLIAMSMHSESEGAVLFGMSWGANFEHPIGEAMVACVAERQPDEEIISWNAFGRGSLNFSSRIEPTAIRRAAQTGSFDLVGLEYAKRLGPLVADKKYVDLFGVSEGGRIMLSAAAHLGRKVRNVTLLDPPGTLGLAYPLYAHRFMSERPHSDAYVEQSMDPAIQAFVPEHQDPTMRWRAIWEDAKRGILLDHYYRSPKAIAKDGLRIDLLNAGRHISGKLAFILPEYTRLNNPGRVRSDLEAMARFFPKIGVELWTLPGTHAIINAGNMVEATLLSFATQH